MEYQDISDILETACVAAEMALVIAVSACALRGGVRVLFYGGETAADCCRRWRHPATAFAIASLASDAASRLGPELAWLAVLAALDCWLVTLIAQRPILPRVVARRTCARRAR